MSLVCCSPFLKPSPLFSTVKTEGAVLIPSIPKRVFEIGKGEEEGTSADQRHNMTFVRGITNFTLIFLAWKA